MTRFKIIISNRERQILQLLSQGLSSQEMAEYLQVSTETIRSHRKSLLLKMDAKNSAHLIRRGFENGMIQLTF